MDTFFVKSKHPWFGLQPLSLCTSLRQYGTETKLFKSLLDLVRGEATVKYKVDIANGHFMSTLCKFVNYTFSLVEFTFQVQVYLEVGR